MAVLWITHPSSEHHDAGHGHPERPGRLEAAAEGIRRYGLDELVAAYDSTPATRDDLTAVHDPELIVRLESLSGLGGGAVDADTRLGPHSWNAALHGAGAGLEAVRRLQGGQGDAAFCAIRPPGHHATRSTAMGFCLVNNVAVTARWLTARGERVLIADIDAHHGNGTQDIFYDDPDVMFVSWHQSPLYPGTGHLDETGTGAGAGTTINLPVPPGATGEHYRDAFERVVVPALATFGPTWLLISAGFDGHRRDPLCDLALTSGDYGDLVADLIQVVPGGRTVAFLEGGYDLEAVTMSVAATVAALGGGHLHPEEPTAGGPGAATVDAAVEIHRRLQ